MKNGVKTIALSILCLGITAILYNHYLNIKKDKHCNLPVSFINVPFEIEPRYLITDQKQIIFSATNSSGYSLYSYKGGNKKEIDNNKNSILYPFLLAGKIAGLQDHNGDENFHSTDTILKSYIGSEPIKTIFSFKKGYLIVIQLKRDKIVYLIDLKKKRKEIIQLSIEKLHSVCFSEVDNFMILNYDNKLCSVDLNKNNNVIALFSNETGDKMTPFIQKKDIYFTDNYNSEYSQILRIRGNNESNPTELIYKSDHDLRLPKVYGDNLFFIEIINSEYLLRSINLKSKEVKNITEKGVVYAYDLLANGEVIFSYSDFNTPKSIFKYKNHSKVNTTSSPLRLELTYEFIKKSGKRSPTYIISPVHKIIKGVILFFHPGLNNDFSPRWDAMLMNLSNSGYIMVCPNYPMSSGYGKSYYNSSMHEAINDIKSWKEFIHGKYHDLPLFYVSSSSGNVLMEQALKEDHNGVNAVASFFGVPSGILPAFEFPCLYILGQNDPIVDFASRSESLKATKFNNFEIRSYTNEGHWFRNDVNLKDAVRNTINFFCSNQ